ncbi:MAG: carboxypeptidase-like regulatory domain-containing protein [bacterium]
MLTTRALRCLTDAVLSCVLALSAATLTAASGQAQTLRGTVRDSVSGLPIAGAVLLLLDSAGAVVDRNIANERGVYALELAASARRVRVQRIGFRLRELRLPERRGESNGSALTFDVVMVAIPTFLERVTVNDQGKCSKRADRAAAFALLEQARNGLLATVVAREANPAAMVRLTYERTMAGTSDRVDHMQVFADSTARSTSAFGAARTAVDFGRRGFADDGVTTQTFFAPDANVLLDQNFADAYCFQLANPDPSRSTQVGLAFVPADRRRGRIDINGVLWIDTVARALRDIEFRYVGVDAAVERFKPGGRISFREMDNGIVLIDRWNLRLIGDSASVTMPTRDPKTEHAFNVHESGGELAYAEWTDGHAWKASLGALRVHALTTEKQPATGTQLWLDDTPYGAIVDSAGYAVFSGLIPGPYSLVIVDPRLRPLNFDLPTPLTFIANRDSVVERPLDTFTTEEFLSRRCIADHRFEPSSPIVFGRVTGLDGQAVEDVIVTFAQQIGPGQSQPTGKSYKTGTDGLFFSCAAKIPMGGTLSTTASEGGWTGAVVQQAMTSMLTILPIRFKPKP